MAGETIEILRGETLTACERIGDERIDFTLADGRRFSLLHQQNCCEGVFIEDIEGDLDDLVGLPLTMAEGTSQVDPDAEESGTWTFYRLATARGYVTIRWYGSSNGYYSESVDFKARRCRT